MVLLFYIFVLCYIVFFIWYTYSRKISIIISFKAIYNNFLLNIFWFFININYNNKLSIKAEHIIAKEIAYLRDKIINPKICPITLKELDSSFNQKLLFCGHRFCRDNLIKYEYQQYIKCKNNLCPICKKKYLIEFNYNYNFYENESIFYNLPTKYIVPLF